jgi:hypothetical protein
VNGVAVLRALGIGKRYETWSWFMFWLVICVCGDQFVKLMSLEGPPVPVYSTQFNDGSKGVAPATAVGLTGASGAVVVEPELASAAGGLPKTGAFTIEDIRRTVDIAIEVSRVTFVFILVLHST